MINGDMFGNEPHPNPNQFYFHRRTMAYLAFAFGVLQTIGFGILAYYNESALAAMGAVVGWSYGLCSLIIASYYGNSAISDYTKGKSK